MNRNISDEIKEEIRTRCDIVELINSYVPLKKTGGRYKACCPFHNEKTPSFTVSPERGMFHCFGCGKGGDVFRFVMDHEGVDFPNAAHILAQRAGVVIPERTQYSGGSGREYTSGSSGERGDQRERLYTLHDKISKWFTSNLWDNKDSSVGSYLSKRNLPSNIVKKFALGAAPDSWDAALLWGKKEGFTEKEMLLCGIITSKEENSNSFYDRFRNRLMFPIWNEQGRVVAFSARTVEEEFRGGKYVNSPETPIFKKSRILYGLPLARQEIQKRGAAIICEGQLDVIAMHRAGYMNSIAPQGTAFTVDQARMLKRYTSDILLGFDSDTAGIKAALKAVEILLPLEFNIRIIEFPEGKDPDDIMSSDGDEALGALIEGAVVFFDFIFSQLSSSRDIATPEGKSFIVDKMIGYLSLIGNPITRASYVQILASRTRVMEESIFAALKKRRSKPQYGASGANSIADEVVSVNSDVIHPAERELLELALLHGTVGKRLEEELPSEMISDTLIGRALEKVVLMTINGEWEFAQKELLDQLIEVPDAVLSEVLSSESEYSHKNQEKAVGDCIFLIKKRHLEGERDELSSQLKESPNDQDLFLKFAEISKELQRLVKAR